ncbi:hypothetical protein HYH03_009936 [Edaphochlamys debaryana]|uniref:WSC domain-containing protein n=1 Tax=Edaphochlamys debaryana TaxID=47281 RepID=A0A835XX21_9CHLO|nr:hypothetical protein HYH03_009936 [Edaphochlamys debaryana]|eukprot:KAG2491776.1 hypothetical protein HYH03_009936 [Edaphochlamys debaryana]
MLRSYHGSSSVLAVGWAVCSLLLQATAAAAEGARQAAVSARSRGRQLHTTYTDPNNPDWQFASSRVFGGATLGDRITTLAGNDDAFLAHGAVRGVRLYSENAADGSAGEQYEAVYSLVAFLGDFPSPPGTRFVATEGEPASGRGGRSELDGRNASSGVRLAAIAFCCTPYSYIAAAALTYSDGSSRREYPYFFQDVYSMVTSSQIEVNITRWITTVALTRDAFSLVSTPVSQNIIFAMRYGMGRVGGTAAESLALTCGTPEGDGTLCSIVQATVAWTAGAAATSWGGSRVRVSTPEYVPFAAWLTQREPGLRAPASNGGGVNTPGWVLDLTAFALARKDMSWKKPGRNGVDLYIIDPYDTRYYDVQVKAALLAFIEMGGGVFVVGPDLSDWDASIPYVPVPAEGGAAGRRRSLRTGDDDDAEVEEEVKEGDLKGLALEGRGQAGGRERLPAGRLAAAKRRWLLTNTTYPVTSVTSTTGATLSTYPVAPAGSIIVSPDTLTNADTAVQLYIQYLRGQILMSQYDLKIAINSVAVGRATLSRTDPNNYDFYTWLNTTYSLGGPVYYLPPPPPPPPPPSIRPPPPRPPSPPPPPPPPALAAPLYQGCFADSSLVRALGVRLSADRAMALELCAGLARGSSLPYFGMQGILCFADLSLTRARSYGQLADPACATLCPGNAGQRCGLVSSSLVLLSIYRNS